MALNQVRQKCLGKKGLVNFDKATTCVKDCGFHSQKMDMIILLYVSFVNSILQ